MIEVRVHVETIDGKQVAFVDRFDRENNMFQSLDNTGQWQDVSLYSQSRPETMLKVRVCENTNSN